VQLSKDPLSTAQLSRLAKLDGLSVAQSISYLNNIAPEITVVDEKEFVEHLHDQITELSRQVPEEFFQQAVFSSKAVSAPGLGDDRDSLPPALYAFSVIPDVHVASVKTTAVTYVPLSFFQCTQRVYKHSPDHAILAQRIHREFAAVLSHRDVAALASPRRTSTRARARARIRATAAGARRPSHLASQSIPSTQLSKTSSPRESVTPVRDWESPSMDRDREPREIEDRRTSVAFGGIMVSSHTEVEVCEKDGRPEGEDWGTRAEAGVASEAPTYVDELFRMASNRWQRR
jgi:hypothetical protein